MRTKGGQVVIFLVVGFLCSWGMGTPPRAALARETPTPQSSTKPWEQLYTGIEQTGDHVIALWQFLPGKETRDNSGHGHDLTLRGNSRFVGEGKFGQCLESFAVDRQEDRPVGAVVKNSPSLTPEGAFTLEMWIRPKPEIEKVSQAFLLDKKYYHYDSPLPQANCDYGWYLRREGPKLFRMQVGLGFGSDSVTLMSEPIRLEPGQWYHVAFCYDGKGTARFFINGQLVGRSTLPGRGPVAPGPHNLVIGDRVGSLHVGFPGYIDQVRIVRGVASFLPPVSLEIAPASRRVWLRMEPEATLRLLVANDSGKSLRDGRLVLDFAGRESRHSLGELPPGEAVTLEIPVDTRLRPGQYVAKVEFHASDEERRETPPGPGVQLTREFPLTIVPRPLPHRMPVILWGSGPTEVVRDFGFTHQMIGLADFSRIWNAGAITISVPEHRLGELIAQLDQCLAHGLLAACNISPGGWLRGQEKLRERFLRVDRQGKAHAAADICGLLPEVESFCYNVGASLGETFGGHPALDAVLIHTEVRDATNLCFCDLCRKSYRQVTGEDIPEEITSKWGLRYSSIPDFPPDRVIPDEYPVLKFYRWFWTEGDGWNRLHSAVHRGLKERSHPGLWTWFDPSVRAPSIWGSGGSVDVLSHWTYTYPDPIKIGLATDELMAMAEGTGRQIMKMTQIIWYRSQTAPVLPEDPAQRAEWEKRIPDARFITIAPDHLREALWLKLSRPIRGIMYHGWGSLVEAGPGAYQYTHPQTKEVLRQLIREVVRPLGPMLLHLEDPPTDVALLESFTSQMLAGRGTYGWGQSWEADVHLILQWARLQPKVIYEETVLRDGLDQYKVLVLPSCDVLPRSIVTRIHMFQKAGGIVIGDQNLCPAIQADYRLENYKRVQKADEDKSRLQKEAEKLRQWLAGRYRWPADSSDPDLIVRRRVAGEAQYLFAINDRRTFGSYVGHHRRVMEQGLPLEADVEVGSLPAAVYDLLIHKEIPTQQTDRKTLWKVALGPGEGRVFLLAPRRIANVALTLPQKLTRDQTLKGTVQILGEDQKPLAAVIPVRVELIDPTGTPAEIAGYYAAKNGILEFAYPFAPNDLSGTWLCRVTELASEKTAQISFVLSP